MTAGPAGRGGALAAGLAAALALAAPATAGLLTTEETLADFQFAGDQVDYRPDPRTLLPARDSPLAFTMTEPALGVAASQGLHDPLRGSLHLTMKACNYGDFEGAPFNVFGSLPPLSRMTEPALLAGSIAALRPDSKPSSLDFLNEHDRLTGPLASRYRGVGIFMLVYGIEDETWVRGFADGAATMELLMVEEGAVRRRPSE